MVKLVSGPAIGILVYYGMRSAGIAYEPSATALVACWVAIWWITEALDIGVTSFVPFVLFPLLGVLDASDVSLNYMQQVIFLFIGGFFIAYAMEKWRLHERIAYRIILVAGSSPPRILMGVMVTAYLLSMWVSNTATTLMLIAAVTSLVSSERLFGEGRKHIATALLLALAYSATVGGMTTLVGTPTNMIFAGFYEKTFGAEEQVSFFRWFAFALPFTFVLLILLYVILRYLFIGKYARQHVDTGLIAGKLHSLGRMGYEEKVVIAVFSTTAVLWFTRTGVDFGSFRIGGWSAWFVEGQFIKDSTVAVVAALVLFLWPSRTNKGGKVLEWKDVTRLPLRVIFLFGSGFALADGFQQSGLAGLLADRMEVLHGVPLWVLLIAIAALVTLLSEFASNVASIQLMLPVMAPMALSLGIDPMLLLVTATLASSFGFMMPVATAPNTIVFSAGHLTVRQMMTAGFLLNITAIVLITIYMSWFVF